MSEIKKKLFDNLKGLKHQSGTHSPSFHEIKRIGIDVLIDACFLSNPYATDLFIKHLDLDLVRTNKLRDYLELYPSQNRKIAKYLENRLNINPENIFIGNGAIEIIQAVLHRFVRGSISVPVPTFSSYYEFAQSDTIVHLYQLNKDNDYSIDLSDYRDFIVKNGIRNAVLINPNNPNGSYVCQRDIRRFLDECKELDHVILDESFIHFANDGDGLLVSNERLINEYPNLVLVKSLSKDFGIAGVRCGYAIMSASKVTELLSNGYLWNSSGLSEYFFQLYSRDEFFCDYLEVRKKYINLTDIMYGQLSSLRGIRVMKSNANFFLIEILDGRSSFEIFSHLLVDFGIYVRDCGDKIGLEGEYIRLASRSQEENEKIVYAFKKLFEDYSS